MRKLITLRGLSLNFTILLFSNTGSSAADCFATVRFLYLKLGSFCNNKKILSCTHFKPPLTGGHPHLKFPLYSTFRAKGGRKTTGLIADTNYEHLECFVMLGMHSQLHRGQMSHIYNISPLRVKRASMHMYEQNKL